VICGLLVGTFINIWNWHYDNFADKWKNEYILSSTANKDVMRGFIKAADKGNKERMMSMFAENVQKDENFSAQVDEFLKEYPGGLYGLKYKDYSEFLDFGDDTFALSTEVVKDGTTYFLDFGGICHDEDNKADVGLKYFYIRSERGEALYGDIKYEDEKEIENTKHISAEINVDGDFLTKRIGGKIYKYKNIDRKLTQSDVVSAVGKAETISELEEILGEPNANRAENEKLVYEIEPENGEPRYIIVSYVDSNGLVNSLINTFVYKKSEDDDYEEYVKVP
jgi:hypothetical protein